MDNGDMKKCPYCAEMIRAEAIKCRYCGSELDRKGIGINLSSPRGFWHRVTEGKKIAGICTGIAAQFDAPVLILPLRVFFVISTLFYGFGPILYILLWLLMPAPVDQLGAGTEKPTAQNQAVRPPESRWGPTPPAVDRYPGHSAPVTAAAPEGAAVNGANSAAQPAAAGEEESFDLGEKKPDEQAK